MARDYQSDTTSRVLFFGGGTDYAAWYNEHGGAVLGTTINKYCFVMLHNGKSWMTFDLPNKSGLGSSSAYTVGLLRVCTDLDNPILAQLATVWEREKLNDRIGSQDQYLCAIGGFHHLRFDEHGIRDTILPPEEVAPLQDYLMLFDTHQYRLSADIVGFQLERMKEHEGLLTAIGLLVPAALESIAKGDWPYFGELLNETWKLKRQLDKHVSTPAIDAIYESAINAGAVGGKLLGAGGGGFMVFFVEPHKQQSVLKALDELTFVPFKFETEGSQVIYDSRQPK